MINAQPQKCITQILTHNNFIWEMVTLLMSGVRLYCIIMAIIVGRSKGVARRLIWSMIGVQGLGRLRTCSWGCSIFSMSSVMTVISCSHWAWSVSPDISLKPYVLMTMFCINDTLLNSIIWNDAEPAQLLPIKWRIYCQLRFQMLSRSKCCPDPNAVQIHSLDTRFPLLYCKLFKMVVGNDAQLWIGLI